MSEFGEVTSNQTLTRSHRVTGNQFRKGVTAPTDATVGTTPETPVLLFDAIAELVTVYFALPEEFDATADVILRVHCALSSVQLNGDVCDWTCDYIAPTITGADGLLKTSTQITGSFTTVTGRLAIADMYTFDLTFPFGDATNPLASALGISAELHLTNLVGVADIHVVAGEWVFEALY